SDARFDLRGARLRPKAMIKRLPADAFRGRGGMRSQSLLASAIAASVILLLSTGLVPAVRVSSAVAGFSFSAAGDAGSWSGFDSSREALGRSGSNFFLAVGDLRYGGAGGEGWGRGLVE